MKHWSSQIFPIVLLAVLAAMSFWLQKAVEPESARPDGKLRHDPDAFAEHATLRGYDSEGNLKYRLSAPSLVHYPDDDSADVKAPVLISYRPGGPSITVSADNGKVTSRAETVFLWDHVVVLREATPEQLALRASMPDLTARPDEGYAFTNSPVEITQGQSWLKGVGAEINTSNSTFVLQSQVTGLYFRPRNSP